MTLPIRYDDAVRLFGGSHGQGLRQVMENYFYQCQPGRGGSYADKERGFLVAQGYSGSRYDMWRSYLSDVRPFTDGGRVTAALPALAVRPYYYGGKPEGLGVSEYIRAVNRSYAGVVGLGVVGAVVSFKT